MTTHSKDDIKQAHDYLIALGGFVTKFARVTRAPRFPDGALETDVEHSFHLALSATELAASYFPHLDVGLVTQFSLVHDFPEVYAGDVWTFGISDEDRLKKEADEKKATEKLLKELPPHSAQLLKRYEAQKEDEAVFVRFIDKFLPAIINYWSKEAGSFLQDYDLSSRKELEEKVEEWAAELKIKFPGQPFLHDVLAMVSRSSSESVLTYLNHRV